MRVLKYPAGTEAVLFFLFRFEQRRDLFIGVSPSGGLEFAQQKEEEQEKTYQVLARLPMSPNTWHTIDLSFSDPAPDSATPPTIAANLDGAPVQMIVDPPVFKFPGLPVEMHIGALYASQPADAEYEIDEVSIQ